MGARPPRNTRGDLVELYLQLGARMMGHATDLIEQWGGGTVILSPRDLEPQQLLNLAGEVNELPGGAVLFDPQFYLPLADHARLVSHAYWPDTYESGQFWRGDGLADLVNRVLDLNISLGTSTIVLPGVHCDVLDQDWFQRQAETARLARDRAPDARLYATLALAADVVRTADSVDEILDEFATWPVDGAYLVCEHPNGNYLVKDSTWITNVVDLAAGVRLKDRHAVLGYCSHQMLIAALASATAIASGTWLNVRSYPPAKFRQSYDDEIRSLTDWYYAPKVLSEYKESTLDTAFKMGMLDRLAPPQDLNATYVTALLAASPPSTVGLDQRSSFRHYLQCLHGQVAQARHDTFAATANAHAGLLDAAELALGELHARRIRGEARDFKEIITPQREALALVEQNRGAILERHWPSL